MTEIERYAYQTNKDNRFSAFDKSIIDNYIEHRQKMKDMYVTKQFEKQKKQIADEIAEEVTKIFSGI